MGLEFLHPWLVIASAALAVAALGLFAWKRKPAVLLFTLGAAAFFLAGARPVWKAGKPDVRHALVVDVSGSMSSRMDEVQAFVDRTLEGLDLPDGHLIVRYELSDALRKPGSARGMGTDFGRLGDLRSDESINGEIIVVTDGHGSLETLYDSIDPPRVILLKPPPATGPDASIASMQAPTVAPVGGSVMVRATVLCDRDADIPWRILNGTQTVARGTKTVKAGIPGGIPYTHVMKSQSLVRLRLVLELAGDREPRNDESSVALFSGGKRVIAYCVPEDAPLEADGLYQLLTAEEHNDVRVRHTLPVGDDELEGFGAVIINNLPLKHTGLTGEQLAPLADWVARGGNLMMVGTYGAFGPGGYRGTPIEDVMPVRFRPEGESRHVVLLLDASSSMEEAVGGERKIDRLKEAGERVLKSLTPSDRVAVVGFREGLVGYKRFVAPDSPRAENSLADLLPGGSTFIAQSLEEAVQLLEDADVEEPRLLIITDGDNVEEGANASRFGAIAQRISELEARLDIVLTNESEREWPQWMMNHASAPDLELWQVGGSGFEDLLETLELALADANREWVIETKMEVGGVAEPLFGLVKTSLRKDESVTPIMEAQTPVVRKPVYPLLAWRQLLGRSVALSMDSWGAQTTVDFWQSEFFQERLGRTFNFLLQNANRVNLVLNPLPGGGAELVWSGGYEPPTGNLQTTVGEARRTGKGRWMLEQFPEGEELRVTWQGELVQRIPLPEPVPYELRATGNNDVFFAMAEQGGLRVMNGLNAWRPKQFGEKAREPIDLTWAGALLALLLMLGGFALRRRG